MNSKRFYKHILKNLFHEQAAEIIPLLMPGFYVKRAIDVELPDLKATLIPGSAGEMEQGIVGLALPGAQILGTYETEWIEHSGVFERAYHIHSPETNKPSYLVVEVQTEREDEMLPRRLLRNFVMVDGYAEEDVGPKSDDSENEQEGDDSEHEQEGTVVNQEYFVYPAALCPFPHSAPAPIRDTFQGKVMLSFNFQILGLWEKDAREFLNTHVSAAYFLLPVMKNVDAPLLQLAVEELVQRFQHDETELGRHLTGLSLLLQQSDTMSEEEKLATQVYLQRFTHLIKNDPSEE